MLFFKKRTPRAKDINNFKNRKECQLTKQFKTLWFNVFSASEISKSIKIDKHLELKTNITAKKQKTMKNGNILELITNKYISI